MEFDNKRFLKLILIIIRCRLSPLNYDTVDELNQPLTFNHQQRTPVECRQRQSSVAIAHSLLKSISVYIGGGNMNRLKKIYP